MSRRLGSALLLFALLLAMAPSSGKSTGCGSLIKSIASWTPADAPASGCTGSMPAASCLGGICVALPAPHKLAVAGIEHHITASPPPDLITQNPPPPQPPPPEV